MNDKHSKLKIENENYGFSLPWHRDFPPMLVVSITNVCNLRCIHCFYTEYSKLPKYHKSFLSMEIWEKICKETSNWPGVIMNFGTDGEPLVHPEFINMLRMARKYHIYPINVTTNGISINSNFIQTVIEENLMDVINISIDAFTDESYKKIRGGSLKKLLNNIHNLIDARNESHSQLKIQVNIIDQPEVWEELEKFKNYWSGLVDNVMVRTYYDATSQQGETGPNITGKQQDFINEERWPCQQFWRRFNIKDDGTVGFCVDDWFNKSKIGDLNKNSIAEIWKSKAYDRLRHLHIMGEFEKIPYCKKCTEWQGMRWDYDYFTAMKKMLGKDFLSK